MDAVIAGATMALLAASVLFQVDDLRRDARERRDVEELLRVAASGAGDPAVAPLGAAMLLGLGAGWVSAGTRAVLGSRTHRAHIEALVACAGLQVPVQRLRRPA